MDVGEGLFLRYQGIFQAHIHTLLLLYKYKWQIRTSLTGKGVMLATLALFKWLEPCSVLGEKKIFFFSVLGKKIKVTPLWSQSEGTIAITGSQASMSWECFSVSYVWVPSLIFKNFLDTPHDIVIIVLATQWKNKWQETIKT